MDIGFRHLAAFVAIAEASSFTRAARSLSLSQPTLTATIRQLEMLLGVQLFDRTTRRVMLTSEGSDFLPKASELRTALATAVGEMRETAQHKRGRVRIAALPTVATRLLPKIVQEFIVRYPEVAVHLRDENDSGIVARLKSGEADIGFGSLLDKDPDLIYRPLFRDPIGLVCRADHPLARGRKPLSWAELADWPFIGFGSDTGIKRLIDRIPNLPQNVSAPLQEASSMLTMEALIEAGVGVTAMFKLAGFRGRGRKLHFRPLANPPLDRTISLISPAERTLSPAAQAMVASIQ